MNATQMMESRPRVQGPLQDNPPILERLAAVEHRLSRVEGDVPQVVDSIMRDLNQIADTLGIILHSNRPHAEK